jgi:hypothetical protein
MGMGEDLVQLLEEILADRTVPRNIREKVETAVQKVRANGTTALSEAIYLLDDISSDINMPEHTRTDIWHAISMIEEAKEKMK